MELAATGQAPPGVLNSCAAYLAHRHEMVVHGGSPQGTTVAEGTWALSLGEELRWEEVSMTGGPMPRMACAGVADPARNRVIFGFGVTTTGEFSDLWALYR